MHKARIALIAIVSVTFAGVLVAAPTKTNSIHIASPTGVGIDILSLSQKARNLPAQSYPAH